MAELSSATAEQPTRSQILCSLSILAKCQSQFEVTKENDSTCGHGFCITSRPVKGRSEVAKGPSSDTNDVKSSGDTPGHSKDPRGPWEYDGIEVFSLDYKGLDVPSQAKQNPQWIHAVASSEGLVWPNHTNEIEALYTTPPKKMRLMSCNDDKESLEDGTILVDLANLTAKLKGAEEVDNYRDKSTPLLSGSEESKQSFFPLAVDDYFMTVAILSQTLGENEKRVGACVVSNNSLRVLSLGYCNASVHAELDAVLNAKGSRVDLTKCSLYTTKPPCLDCTQAILQTGIRVVVYGDVEEKGLDKDVYDLVYQAKACFQKYKCRIRIEEKEKRFLINISGCEVVAKNFDSTPNPKSKKSKSKPQEKPRPSYRDFFMAMAFLSHTRAKDMKYQVGACLVTPAPHRLVAMGYNGMPDGRGFRDDKMDWGSEQSEYTCHAELNAIIAAFRREADLSACTLYTTHSPCNDCSKLIAQSGIRNLVFAKYFHNGTAMYETLGRLKDMNIMRYEYMETGYGNVAKILIDLKSSPLSTTLEESRTIPQTKWDCEGEHGTRCCPMCLSKDYKKPDDDQCPMCHGRVFKHPSMAQKGKGRREVDFPLDDYFMSLAVLAECRCQLSGTQRVGTCLVYQEPRRAISVGYSGHIDGLSDGKKGEKDNVCCAEFNAIVSAFRYHADLTSATLYTTGFPCPRCATKIVQSGIKTIVYSRKKDVNQAEDKREAEMRGKAEEIFYWGKIATLEYQHKTRKPFIEIDLRGLVVDQRRTAQPLIKGRRKSI